MILAHLLVYVVAASSTSLITARSNGKPCPTINGEILAPCGSACYSRFIYTCPNGEDLVLRPPPQGAFRLVAEDGPSSSSASSAVAGQPMTACRLAWRIGGKTCSRCPGSAPLCPAGDVAAVALLGDVGEASMSAEVAGGQAIYVTRDFTVGYQPAHMSTPPDGARLPAAASSTPSAGSTAGPSAARATRSSCTSRTRPMPTSSRTASGPISGL